MHTRCPQCQTVFVVQPAQLTAREGLVRCGRCRAVFNAQEASVEKTAGGAAAATPVDGKAARKTGARDKKAAGRKTASEATSDAVRRRRKTAMPPPTPPQPDDLGPLQLTLPGLAPPPRTRLPFWILGNLLLLCLLLSQVIYFYGSDLVRLSPPLKPALREACGVLGCELTPPQDINLLELVEARVAPHPKFNKALRIRATLVNRASFSQGFPIMEVTLSDNRGQIIARRAFKPAEYVEKTHAGDQLMPPNVAIPVLLDVTHPDHRALGYEIRLLPAH